MNNKSVAYIYSKRLENECNRLPTMLNRASMVQDLIDSYQILSNDKVYVVQSLDATEDELKLFHSSSYVDFLKEINDKADFEDYDDIQLEFGLGYDCPILQRNYDFVRTVAGGSVSAAKLLIRDKCKIAINWFGGWHHAQRDSAEGFCYVNDVVLAIQKLTEKFDKILYLDLDIHHGNDIYRVSMSGQDIENVYGDGVQNAFELSRRILTVSFHKLAAGFYPGTGALDSIGLDKAKYYSINVPFLDGVSPKSYLKVFDKVFPSIVSAFAPKALVVQCGADSLNGDKVGDCNLTLKTIGSCVGKVLECQLPTLFLGGGGYNLPNSARLWAYLTSVILGITLDDDIPDTSEYFTDYGPTYELHVSEGNKKDYNTEVYTDHVTQTVLTYCKFIQCSQ